jgi:Transposase DDE domain/Insertion element 4 transposase N-terminal
MSRYRLREMDVDDKVCDQVSMSVLREVYPHDVIERCVQQSQPWSSKARRVRASTVVTLVLFVIAMALWSRLNQCQVWHKLVGKLSLVHPAEPDDQMSDSGLSGRRHALGSQGLQTLMRECCRLLAQPHSMPSAFFGRYRLMAIDGTVFKTADTLANEQAFGRSSNQYGKGAYPQVRGTLLAECGSHAVVGLELDRYDVSEVHGAHRLLQQVGFDMLVLMDAGITSGGFLEHLRRQRAHGLGALEAGVWENVSEQCRLSDGTVLAWIAPSRPSQAHYPVQRGVWVRIISYRVTDERLGERGQVYRLVTTLLNPRVAPALTLVALYHERWEVELVIDEIKTHERAQRKVLRSKTPEGVVQELYGLFLAHYAVRVMMAQAAREAGLDPDRLSFSEGLFQLSEILDLALILEPEESIEPLLRHLSHAIGRVVLPVRRVRINRREVKQVYNKYKPKKRDVPPPKPFEPGEQFLDFVQLLDPLAPALIVEALAGERGPQVGLLGRQDVA